MNDLREVFQKYAAVVFFDTETSGLDADTCQIIELAAIRIEQTDRGTLRVAKTFDDFIRLPEGEKLPEKIAELTGITDEMLEKEGLDENDAVYDFEELLDDTAGPVLLAAHNAQFDLQFAGTMAERYAQPCAELLARADYLDTLTCIKIGGHILTSWRTRSRPTSWRTRCRTPTGRSTTWRRFSRYAGPWTTSGPIFWSM